MLCLWNRNWLWRYYRNTHCLGAFCRFGKLLNSSSWFQSCYTTSPVRLTLCPVLSPCFCLFPRLSTAGVLTSHNLENRRRNKNYRRAYIQTTFVRGDAFLLIVPQKHAKPCGTPLSNRSQTPCMWWGSGNLVWFGLAGWLAGWPGVTVGLPTKSCCFRTNQPADRGSHAACSCCESQIFSPSLCQPLFWLQSGFMEGFEPTHHCQGKYRCCHLVDVFYLILLIYFINWSCVPPQVCLW